MAHGRQLCSELCLSRSFGINSLGVLASFTIAMLVAFVARRLSFGLICGALILHVRPDESGHYTICENLVHASFFGVGLGLAWILKIVVFCLGFIDSIINIEIGHIDAGLAVGKCLHRVRADGNSAHIV